MTQFHRDGLTSGVSTGGQGHRKNGEGSEVAEGVHDKLTLMRKRKLRARRKAAEAQTWMKHTIAFCVAVRTANESSDHFEGAFHERRDGQVASIEGIPVSILEHLFLLICGFSYS